MTNKENPTTVARISEITAEGFRLHAPIGEYYISRKKYPWFRDATDEEIRDVTFSPEAGEGHVNMLFWNTLGIDFDEKSIKNPELNRSILVRCTKRPDLFTETK